MVFFMLSFQAWGVAPLELSPITSASEYQKVWQIVEVTWLVCDGWRT